MIVKICVIWVSTVCAICRVRSGCSVALTAVCVVRSQLSADLRARDEAAECVTAAENIGCPTVLNLAYFARGFVEAFFDAAQAGYWCRKSIDVLGTAAGSAVMTGHAYATLCLAAAGLGDQDLLLKSLRDAVSFARASTMWITLYGACDYGGQALIELGHPALGVQLIGAAAPHRSFTGAEADRRTRALDTARAQLDEAAYDHALRFAEHLNPDEVSAHVLAEITRLEGDDA